MERVTCPEDVSLRDSERKEHKPRSVITTSAEGRFVANEIKAFIRLLDSQLEEKSIWPDGSLPGTEEYRVKRHKASVARYHEQLELHYVVSRTQELEREEKKPACDAEAIVSEARKHFFALLDLVKYLNDDNCKLVLSNSRLDDINQDLRAQLTDVQNQLDAERRRRR